MIPLFVDCTGKKVVIFGGGVVAARKAARFAQKADVLIVSRSFSKRCRTLLVHFLELDTKTVPDETINTIIDNAFLVIAALSDTHENNRIGHLCRKNQVLFNNADGENGDVVIPAVSEGRHYVLAISTHGESPAISRFLRQEIEKRYPALDAMIELQGRLRERLKTVGLSQADRSAILWKVLNDHHIWNALRYSPDDTWAEVERRYLHD
jgi:precorrin-2 dehydrogenase / sirohydrochlorin ferrochelatase